MSETKPKDQKPKDQKPRDLKSPKASTGTPGTPRDTAPPPSSSTASTVSEIDVELDALGDMVAAACEPEPTEPTEPTVSSPLMDSIRRQYAAQPNRWRNHGRFLLGESGVVQSWNTRFGRDFDEFVDSRSMSDEVLSGVIALYQSLSLQPRELRLIKTAVAVATFEFLGRRLFS